MIRRIKTKIKELWAELALLSVEVIIVSILFSLALIVFVYMVRRVFILGNNQFDQTVYQFLGHYVNKTNNRIMLFFTFLGKQQFLIPANIILVLYFLLVRKHKWYSLRVAAISLSSLALMFILKLFFDRPRPSMPLLASAKGLSFPSGHALMAVTFYGLLCYISWYLIKNHVLKWTLIAVYVFFIFMIGLSRIYLHVHYTSDVIAGYCMGMIWLYISLKFLRRLENYSRKEMEPMVDDKVSVRQDEL
jgi:membrane-associated phospholipid phosphatase